VVGWHVEGLKIVPVVFSLRPLHDLKAHRDENVLQFLAHLGHQVQLAPGDRGVQRSRQRPAITSEQAFRLGKVQAFRARPLERLVCFELCLALGGQGL
jgi:hypothetical protein